MAPDAEAQGEGTSDSGLTPLQIVAINSDAEFMALLRLTLRSAGYSVITTAVSLEPFAQIVALNPAAILVDLVPGEQAGWALLQRLCAEERTRDIPVVVTATLVADLERVQAHPDRYAGNAFLAKPFDRADLLQAICALIGPPASSATSNN